MREHFSSEILQAGAVTCRHADTTSTTAQSRSPCRLLGLSCDTLSSALESSVQFHTPLFCRDKFSSTAKIEYIGKSKKRKLSTLINNYLHRLCYKITISNVFTIQKS